MTSSSTPRHGGTCNVWSCLYMSSWLVCDGTQQGVACNVDGRCASLPARGLISSTSTLWRCKGGQTASGGRCGGTLASLTHPPFCGILPFVVPKTPVRPMRHIHSPGVRRARTAQATLKTSANVATGDDIYRPERPLCCVVYIGRAFIGVRSCFAADAYTAVLYCGAVLYLFTSSPLYLFLSSADGRRVPQGQDRRPTRLGVPLGYAVRYGETRLPSRPKVQAAQAHVR